MEWLLLWVKGRIVYYQHFLRLSAVYQLYCNIIHFGTFCTFYIFMPSQGFIAVWIRKILPCSRQIWKGNSGSQYQPNQNNAPLLFLHNLNFLFGHSYLNLRECVNPMNHAGHNDRTVFQLFITTQPVFWIFKGFDFKSTIRTPVSPLPIPQKVEKFPPVIFCWPVKVYLTVCMF